MATGFLAPLPITTGERAIASTVRRRFFYLQSQGQSLSACLHHRDILTDHGVVLCPPIGYEQVHSQRTWRFFADQLASAGLVTLRFDYHGAGDSAGRDEDADRVATWLPNIADARRWLREALGCAKISLAGLRFGATLAVQSAAVEEVDGLLLWAPIISGRSYLRELKALSMTASIKAPPLPEAPHDIEAAGFVVTKQTAVDLGKLDLLQTKPRCRRALIIARDDVPEERRLLAHLRTLDIAAEQVAQPGYADMMAEPHFTRVPSRAIANAIQWFLSSAPATQSRVVPSLAHASGSESPRDRLCEFDGLVGTLTEPERPRADLPVVMMLNAGAASRVGPSRLHVLLARELAERGFRSLRVDLGGFGDSVPSCQPGDTDCYRASVFRDIETVLRHAKEELGAKRVVLAGLCSGAYFAFQAAAQMDDPALCESILINPLTFYWKDGMSLNDSPTKDDQAFEHYRRSALDPRKWVRLLSGQSQIGITGAIAAVGRRWWTWLGQPTGESSSNQSGAFAHPGVDDLTADLRRVAKHGRHLACFFASADPGHGILMFRAGQKATELQEAGKLDMTFIDDADHTFSFRVPRQALIQAIADHLDRRYHAPLRVAAKQA